jgi:AcrR family transcriptional regulator
MPASPPAAAALRSERVERKRQRILDAAGQCFAASGYAKTTVEEIARAAGVSKALVYQHFRGKEEILEAVLERTLLNWARVARVESLPAANSVLEALADTFRSAVAYARDNPVLRAFFRLDPLVLMGIGSRAVRRQMDEVRRALVDAIAAGVASGELREDLEVGRVADVIRILQIAFIDHVINPDWLDASDEGLVETSIDMLSHGIAARRRR